MSEVFRFSITRPTQRMRADNAPESATPAYPANQLSANATRWLAAPAAEAAVLGLAFTKSPEFVVLLTLASPPLASVDEWLRSTARPPSPDAMIEQVERAFGSDIQSIAGSEHLSRVRERLADSLLATALSRREDKLGHQLTRTLRVVHAISILATHRESAVSARTLRGALRARIVFPSLPTTKGVANVPRAKPAGSKAHLARYFALGRDLDLLSRYAARVPAPLVKIATSAGVERFGTTRTIEPAVLEALSPEARVLITQGPTMMTAYAEIRRSIEDERDRMRQTPLVPVLGGSLRALAPATVGVARLSGISDLLVVRQTHTRYRLGEISHIENILPHEVFSRQYRRATSLESFEETEREVVETSERELQTTARTELRDEIRRSLQERIEFEAGADLTYTGPNVEVGVNAGFAYERATEEASESASTFARDVVDRAASSVSETARELRSTRRRTDTEDISNRSITNDTVDATVGMYRWVDRIVGFEVLNYDRRLLVEFVVPEPAAYLRYAMSRRQPRGTSVARPLPLLADEYGFPDENGEPLSPELLNVDTLGAWIARYGVTGLAPPPPETITVGVAVGLEESADAETSGNSTAKVLEPNTLSVPGGYVATDMEVAIASEWDNENRFYNVKIGGASVMRRVSGEIVEENITPAGMSGNIPVTLLAKFYENFALNIVLTCTRTDAKLIEWQIQTFEKIVNEYRRQLAEYLDNVAGAKIQEGIADIGGTNPITLRDLERVELKRASVKVLNGQTFDLFDGIREGTEEAPTEMSFPDVEAEGAYIQFVEQAFEWHRMSYVFYPYFWGRKQHWEEVAFEDHIDALFGRFLRAGSARVVVPVRVGFEPAVDYFLKTGIPWLGVGPPTLQTADDADPETPPFIHVAMELGEQLGNDFRAGEGTISTTTGDIAIDLADAIYEVGYTWLGRKIRIDGATYRIVSLGEHSTASLDRPFAGTTGARPFEVGPRVVGQPWETVLPTTLVALDGEVAEWPRIDTEL